jgi:precorrin-6A synthase
LASNRRRIDATAPKGGEVRKLFLIGIGSGDPDHLTLQAIEALRRIDVFFVVDKGPEKSDLTALRTEMCRRHRPDAAYRTVDLVDPPRDRQPDDYRAAVRDWHDRRAALYEQAIAEALAEGECGAFLVWGDPAIYDSTLRIVDDITAAGRVALDVEVIPGISSVQVLAARHRIPLNRIGEAVHITTGRKLAAGDVPDTGDLVVMLDGTCAFTTVTEDVDIFWGAYLGTPDELLVAGRLADVRDEIERTRAEARAAHGWIMDIYLLRRRP